MLMLTLHLTLTPTLILILILTLTLSERNAILWRPVNYNLARAAGTNLSTNPINSNGNSKR